MSKYFLTFVLILICNYLNSQQKEYEKVDSLIQLSVELSFKDGLKSLQSVKEACEISESLNDDRLIAKSTINLVRQLLNMAYYQESLQQISDLENRIILDDELVKSEIKHLKFSSYIFLGLDDLGLKELDEAIKILESLNSTKARESLADFYLSYSNYYAVVDEFEKANYYIEKTLKISKNTPLRFLEDVYVEKAYICIGLEKLDSSQIYIQKAFEEHAEKFSNSSRHFIYALQGDQYLETKNYHEAIKFYKMSLKEMETFKISDLNTSQIVKSSIAEIYGILGDAENQKKYKEEAYEEDSKLEKKSNQGLQQAVNNILKDGKKDSRDIKIRNKWIILSISSTSLILLSFLFFRNWKIRKNKRIIIQQKENLILENSELERQKENLNRKAEENQLAELIDLAKINNPSFVVLLEELFPDFVRNLKLLNPKINNSELHFCGLAFLNFSTKEISEFTYVTIAAVQLRKHRIRKKYDIPSDKDFNAWMTELNAQHFKSK